MNWLLLISLSLATGCALAETVPEQEQGGEGAGAETEAAKLQAIVVSGSRLQGDGKTMPQAVDYLEAKDIEAQLSISPDIETVLANLVPGLSRSSNSTVSTYMSLRGRKPVILVDGIPVTSTLNDTGREVRLIDPTSIDHIEVVRGSSALYGQSAGAGFINYITKAGDPEPVNLRTEVASSASLTHFSGDSLAPSIRQVFSGSAKDFDYRVGAYYEKTNSLFDANGDRLPPRIGAAIDNSTIKSGYGKLGYTFDDQRLEASFNYYKQESAIKYGLVNGDIAHGIPASAERVSAQPGEVPQSNDNLMANLVYSNASLFGTSTSFRAQIFHTESYSIFQYVKNRFPKAVSIGQSPDGQSANDTHKNGARIDFNTPLSSFTPFNGKLSWGFDYLRDSTTIPLIDGRAFGIPQILNSYAGFAELQIKPIDPLTLTMGIRREIDRLDVGNFFSLFTLAHITGGRLNYSATPVNFGAVYSIDKAFDVFAGFSQGFDIQQTSQNFRAWPVDINLSKTHPPANVIDSYETGVRYHSPVVEASLTAYLNKSSNGVSYVYNATTPKEPTAVVAPDRVYGVEFKAEYKGIKDWQLGASYAWMEGRADANNDGKYDTWLQDRRIPPPSVNVYAQWDFSEDSNIRLQGLYSGDRNRFPNATPGMFHQGHVHPYVQFDIAARFKVGRGELSLGIENLLNRDYFTNYSEGYNSNDNYIKAPGRTLNVRYGITY